MVLIQIFKNFIIYNVAVLYRDYTLSDCIIKFHILHELPFYKCIVRNLQLIYLLLYIVVVVQYGNDANRRAADTINSQWNNICVQRFNLRTKLLCEYVTFSACGANEVHTYQRSECWAAAHFWWHAKRTSYQICFCMRRTGAIYKRGHFYYIIRMYRCKANKV